MYEVSLVKRRAYQKKNDNENIYSKGLGKIRYGDGKVVVADVTCRGPTTLQILLGCCQKF